MVWYVRAHGSDEAVHTKRKESSTEVSILGDDDKKLHVFTTVHLRTTLFEFGSDLFHGDIGVGRWHYEVIPPASGFNCLPPEL